LIEYQYRQTDELPTIPFDLYNNSGTLHDLSTATFTFRLRDKTTGTVALTKTSGIVGAATAPNATVVWSAGDLAAVAVGNYWGELSYVTGSGLQWSLPRRNRPSISIVA
jgi:hypothetical protein